MDTEERSEARPPAWRWATVPKRQRWVVAWGVGWRLVVIGVFVSVVLAAFAIAVAVIAGVPVRVSFAGKPAETVTIDPSAVGFGLLKSPTTAAPARLSPLTAGDCFNTDVSPKGSLTAFTPTECTEPHVFEVSGVIDASVYGPHSELANDGYCLTAANTYLGGTPNVANGLEADWFAVAHDTPDGLICVVRALAPVARSVAGSLR